MRSHDKYKPIKIYMTIAIKTQPRCINNQTTEKETLFQAEHTTNMKRTSILGKNIHTYILI